MMYEILLFCVAKAAGVSAVLEILHIFIQLIILAFYNNSAVTVKRDHQLCANTGIFKRAYTVHCVCIFAPLVI